MILTFVQFKKTSHSHGYLVEFHQKVACCETRWNFICVKYIDLRIKKINIKNVILLPKSKKLF